MSTKQTKVTISFKENDLDKELYLWLQEKSKIIGMSAAIKLILHEKHDEELKNRY